METVAIPSGVHQARNRRDVCQKPGGKDHGRLDPFESGDTALQLLQQSDVAPQFAGFAGSHAEFSQCRSRSLHHFGSAAQPQIIVGGERYHPPTVQGEFRGGWAVYDRFAGHELLCIQPVMTGVHCMKQVRDRGFFFGGLQKSDIQAVLSERGFFLDEFEALYRPFSHEAVEGVVGGALIIDIDLEQTPGIDVHGGLPELGRNHLAQTLEAGDVDLGVGTFFADLGDDLLFFRFIEGILAVGAGIDPEQGRLRQIEMTVANQLRHETVEKGQKEAGDVSAVDVGVGHDDHAAVTEAAQVELLAEPGADGGDQVLDFGIFFKLVQVGLLDVENLTPKRQHRLGMTVTGLFCRTTC